MSADLSKPSFSPGRKWSIGLHVCFILLVVFGVVVMANYLSRDYFMRFHISTQTRNQLSPLTVNLLKSLTNQVKVTLYYDRNDALYSTIADLLTEYQRVNPRITVQNIDYKREPGAADEIKNHYQLAAATDKNLVIFDCDGRKQVVSAAALAEFVVEEDPNGKDGELRKRMTTFQGEKWFTSALVAVTSPKPLKAYFLTGHGEGSLESMDELNGYAKLAALLRQNYVQLETLSLLTTNPVPLDCNLLVVAGPTQRILEIEVDKIEQYLNEGGRLLALFNFVPIHEERETGLEALLAKWGVDVTTNIIKDPENSRSPKGQDVVVSEFGKHPTVSSLVTSRLHLSLPRSVAKLPARGRPAADAPHVDELAFSGTNSFAYSNPGAKHRFPLMVAVEKGTLKNVITERGTTRMVVAGDSIFLANSQIESAANRDFAGFVANWLLDRTQLYGVPGRKVTNFRILMTSNQVQQVEAILLAGMPGAVLLLGCLVWLQRRR